MFNLQYILYLGSFNVWSSSLWNVHNMVFFLLCVCVYIGGSYGIWLRYATEELVTVDHCMSVLGLLGSSHHSWVAGCPWRWERYKSLLGFHYLWLCQSDIRSLHLCYSAHSSRCQWDVQQKITTAADRQTLGCLTLLWLLGETHLMTNMVWSFRSNEMWKPCFTISKNVRML